MKLNERSFIAGIAYSAAIVNELYDQPAIAKTILKESGFTKENFRLYSDKHDWKNIKDLFE